VGRSLRSALTGLTARRPALSPWLIGPLAALWAAAIGLAIAAVPMVVIWMASPQSGLTWIESMRLAGLVWVMAQGAPITIAGVTYSLLPWGLAIIPLLLLGYAGGWAMRRLGAPEVRPGVALVASGTLTYAAVAGLVAFATAGSSASVAVPAAVVSSAGLALVGLGWSVARVVGAGGAVTDHLPWLPTVLRSGVVAALVVVGLGAVVVAVSLMTHVDDAITMTQSLHVGFWGGLGLLALGVSYAPVAAVWGAAYLLGAGVVVGPAITVSPFIAVTSPTSLPPFPLLAALPQSASPLAWAMPLAGVLAGVVAGLIIGRSARREHRLVRLALAAGAAALTGGLLALAAYLASGSLGDLRLAQVGPVPLTVGVLGAVLVALGAVPSAVAPAPPERPRLSVMAGDDSDPHAHAPEDPE
jgi:hypothetical protein